MAVIKNLMVRIVTNASSLVNGMKTAKTSTEKTTGSIKAATSGMRKNVKESFSAAGMSVREYSAYVAKTRQDHTVAGKNVERLKDKLGQLKTAYGTIQSATAGLDLSKPLTEQIAKAESNLDEINAKIHVTKMQLQEVGNSKSVSKYSRMAKLQGELAELQAESDATVAHLDTLAEAVSRVGAGHENIAPTQALRNLQTEIQNVEKELKVAQAQADKTGERLRSMGTNPNLRHSIARIGHVSRQAVSGGVNRLGTALKKLGSSAAKGIASLPAMLLRIGKSASSSTGGLNKMARSIKRIGVVSFGLRIATGMFGRLRTIVSSYISQNESLSNSVQNLKTQLGEALAPAIKLVIVLMQKLMPIITTVANAINSILTALFGNLDATTSAIQDSAAAAGAAASSLETYGFDQITKVSDGSSGSSVSTSTDTETGEQSALVQKLTDWISKLKNAFTAGDWKGFGRIVGDGINSAVASIDAIDVGGKIGTFTNNLVTALDNALSTIDFEGFGGKIGQMLTTGLEKVDWSQAGNTVGNAITAIPSTVVGFAQGTDWNTVAESLSNTLTGALSNIGNWIREVDWLRLGDQIWEFVANIDYGGICKNLFSLLGSALGAAVATLWGFIENVVTSIGTFFSEKIQECGGSIVKGLFNGILEGISNLYVWLRDNVFKPFIEGFCAIFGIHSPSTVMAEKGGFLAEGVLNGFAEGWKRLLSFLSEGLASIKSRIAEAWTSCRTATSQKWSEITGSFSGKLSEMKTAAYQKFNGIRNTCSEILSNMGFDMDSATEGITGKAIAGFDAMKQGVSDIFSNMWTDIKGWINSIIIAINGMISGVTGGLNAIIRSLNKISFKIPDWMKHVPGASAYAGKRFGFNINEVTTVQIPMLGEGGIADGPTAAIIGEAGKEAVLPLEGRNASWMDTLVQKINEAGGSNGTPLIVQIMLGGRKVTEYFIKDVNQITKTTGVCPIKV